MTFEVYNQTLSDIETKLSQSHTNESEIVTKLDNDRQVKISELKDERRKYLADWDMRFRSINMGVAKVIDQARASEKAVRVKLDESRRRLSYEYNEGKGALK